MSLRSFRRIFGVGGPALLALGALFATALAPGAPPPEVVVELQAFDVDEDGVIDAEPVFESKATSSTAADGDLLLQLDPDDAAAFEDLTEARVGLSLHLVVDGEDVATPVVREAISGSTLRIDAG